MNFLEAKIYTTTEALDLLTSELTDIGINGFVIEDSTDFKRFLTDTSVYWDYVDDKLMRLCDTETNITVYLPDNAQGSDTLSQLKALLDTLRVRGNYGRLSLELTDVREEDWANNWKKYFKPFELGSRFVIKPTWETYENPCGRFVLELDPSTAFGTGGHETTQLCIESLEEYVKSGSDVLDMGCGSGILSVAALYLGAKSVRAFDIDKNAVRIARENAALNGFNSDVFRAESGNVLTDASLRDSLATYDVIAANIVADVIIAMIPLFKSALNPCGTLVTSGIIGERADEVAACLVSAGFDILCRKEKNGWVCLHCRVQ